MTKDELIDALALSHYRSATLRVCNDWTGCSPELREIFHKDAQRIWPAIVDCCAEWLYANDHRIAADELREAMA